MCTKHAPSDCSGHLFHRLCSMNCTRFPIVSSSSCKHFTDKLRLGTKLWNFKFQSVTKFYVHISPIFSCWVMHIYNERYVLYMHDENETNTGYKLVVVINHLQAILGSCNKPGESWLWYITFEPQNLEISFYLRCNFVT